MKTPKMLLIMLAFLVIFNGGVARAADSTSIMPNTSSMADLDMSDANILNVNDLDAGSVRLTSVQTVGNSCEVGRMARDASGEFLVCKNGFWATVQNDFPPGSWCGMWSSNPVINHLCQGHNPGSSCPSGFSRYYDGDDFRTCVKN